MNRLIALLCCVLFVASFVWIESVGGQDECFSKSLHATGEGMRYWYEEEGGLMTITGIPYADLDCSKCHIKSCEQCHLEQDEGAGTCALTNEKARNTETCLVCHGREKLTYKMCETTGTLDVHGRSCSDCHSAAEMHGDGKSYSSMRDPAAPRVACTDCHAETMGESRAHTVHKEKLDCAACHVSATTACMNCHMDTFLETGSRKGTFFPMQDWLLLINYDGKITSATAMTIVYEDKKFVCYGPYFTHAVQGEGKQCTDCHGTEAVKMIKAGESVPMMKYEDGAVVSWKGVVPVVDGQLDWVYLNKKGDAWEPVANDDPATVQYVAYGTPLTEEQIKKMAMPFKK